MPRFILRFTGSGAKPADDLQRIRTQPETKVLDETERMILLEASPAKVAKLQSSLKDWSVCAEQSVPLPDPRPKLRGPAKP